MNESSPADAEDQIVSDYLATVARAAADLPPTHRDELLADLTEHIAVARSQHVPTVTSVRAILDRLGHPLTIVEVARGFAADRPDEYAAPPQPAPTGVLAEIWHRSPLAAAIVVVAALAAITLIAGIVPTVLAVP